MAKYEQHVPDDQPAFTEQEPDTKSLSSFSNHGLEVEKQVMYQWLMSLTMKMFSFSFPFENLM